MHTFLFGEQLKNPPRAERGVRERAPTGLGVRTPSPRQRFPTAPGGHAPSHPASCSRQAGRPTREALGSVLPSDVRKASPGMGRQTMRDITAEGGSDPVELWTPCPAGGQCAGEGAFPHGVLGAHQHPSLPRRLPLSPCRGVCTR